MRRPPLPPRLSTFALCLGLSLSALSLSACEKGSSATPEDAQDPIDSLALALLDALEDSDRDALAQVCAAKLASELGERDLSVFARTLHWLGRPTLSAEGEEAVVGGVNRRYTVAFEHGEVGLELTVVDGKVEGFSLEEARWEALVERALEVDTGSLRIASFHFVGAEGEPLEAPTDPGQIAYSLSLEGLDSQLREHHVTIDKSVVDAEGREVYRQREPDEIRFPQAESGSAGGRITGELGVPGPGSYTLKLKIVDLVAGQDMTHEVAFEIGASAP